MNAEHPARFDPARHLEELAQQQEDDDTVWRPTIYPAAELARGHPVVDLVAGSETITVHDRIASQIRELVDTRHPRRPRLSEAELDALVARELDGRPASRYGSWVFYPWSRRLVHVLGPSEFRELRTSRNRNKITAAEQARLGALDLAIVGLSVGRATAITLALEGVGGRFRLADFDTLDLSNLNRLRAGVHEIGLNKAVLTARELFEIDPYLDIDIWPEGITRENVDVFLTGGRPVDILFEECDDLEMKLRVREAARRHRIVVLMETSDRGMLDIERFDLEPDRELFHGLAGHLEADALRGLDTYEKVPVVAAILGLPTLSRRMAASMVDIDATIKTWPQLASGVALGGALNTEAARRLVLGELRKSGRYYVDLEQLVRDGTASDRRATRAPQEPDRGPPLAPAPLPELRAGRGPISVRELEDLVTWACRAPSGGNSQPWRFEHRGDVLECSVDPERATSLLDAGLRAAHLACGAAAEHIALVAPALGLVADIDMLPEGAGSTLAFRVALARVEEPVAPDPLVAQIEHRTTNRQRRFERRPLAAGDADALAREARARDASLQIVADPAQLERLAGALASAEKQRLLSARLHREMFGEIRWNRRDALRTADGLDAETLELDPTERAGMSLLSSWDTMRTLRELGGGQGLERPTRDAVASASAMALLSVDARGPVAYARAGRALARVWLRATERGVAVQPMTAVLFVLARLAEGDTSDLEPESIEVFEATGRDLWTVFSVPPQATAVMLLRLAHAPPPSARSLRRPVRPMPLGPK
jgi:molybdopterin/thiamine biosynthesis adenylyltransferase